MAARGEPMIWLMGLALIVCFLAVLSLVTKVVFEGAKTFWPRPIERIQVRAGSFPMAGRVLYGLPVREEVFEPTAEVQARIDALKASNTLPAGSLTSDGKPIRRQYNAGNRDVTQEPFYWIPLIDIEAVTVPENTAVLERETWGIWLGTPRAIIRQLPTTAETPKPAGSRVDRVTLESGKLVDRIYEVEGPEAVAAAFPEHHARAVARRERLEHLTKSEMGEVNDKTLAAELRQRELDRLLTPLAGEKRHEPSAVRWFGFLAVAAVGLTIGWRLSRRRSVTEQPPVGKQLAARAALVMGVAGLLGVAVERPWREVSITPESHASQSAEISATLTELRARYQALEAERRTLQAEDAEWRIIVTEATGKAFAPVTSTDQDQPLLLSQIVRSVRTNDLSTMGKVGVYLDRWSEFLTADPRSQNSEGGVFPVIVGTVLMTLLLSVIVVPFGVIAALYLREYARQGVVTSLIRIAINNLAGVPSIVFGMFGFGFFCTTLGQYIDSGPPMARRAEPGTWWIWAAGTAVVVFGAAAMAIFARPTPGQPIESRHRAFGFLTAGCWFLAAGFAVALAATTPYFAGFFSARPGSTFGSKGLLWSALTLALLTLPVVIVATEEAVAAVPRSMREGSYGCGASKWQTIRRIVLPGAMPGIMTGMILAMARGAGEVAPLMLVGALKEVNKLPFSSSYPFLHAERAFMHLGFHILDLGFQSPNAEAARPLVWTTTLLLLSIVVFLNLAAILIRARLKARSGGSGI